MMDIHRHLNRTFAAVIACVMAGSIAAMSSEALGSSWERLVVQEQSQAERLASIDLRRYLGQVTDHVPELLTAAQWRANPEPAIILGTSTSNDLLAQMEIPAEALGEQGYYLSEATLDDTNVVIACGATPVGAVNAIYGLLRELGFGFYLGSEAVPEMLPAHLSRKPVLRKPALAIRGVLPWYNFFNSPTVWEPRDHRAFVDQLIRMGANFVGFHTYDSEPFAAYEADGQMHWGKRLLNTGSSTWGTLPLSTRQFGFGTNQLFPDPFFGATTSLLDEDEREVIRKEQAIMREALDYAHQRGLHTCLGFEIGGDPLDSAVREVFLKRVNHVLDQYPALDYIWLWQMETQGVQGFRETYNLHILPTKPLADSPLHAYAEARRPAFNRIIERSTGEPPFFDATESGKHARAMEGARLEQFAQLAWRTMQHRQNPPRLVISGWGGDERLLSAEYYDGLDKLLPPDVVFASLDHIIPRTRVDAIYHELPPQRERWPIPWLEYDGDQWHPQPYVHVYEQMMRDILKSGSQGALGIHWRTRDLEENFAYLIDAAWDPELTAERFFADLAGRCYSPTIAEEMVSIHIELDRLGYRWVGGGGQAECAPFNWGPGETDKSEAVIRLRQRTTALLDKETSSQGRARLRWLLNRMDWVLRFREAELAAVHCSELLTGARAADGEQAKELAHQALAVLDDAKMAAALRTYASRVSTRGEYGVLATINTKALARWRDLRRDCLKLTGDPDRADAEIPWTPQEQIILPRFPGCATEDEPLTLDVLVPGGRKAWLHYRPLNSKTCTAALLSEVSGWVQRGIVPASAMAQPGVEVAFSLSRDSGKGMLCGPFTITVLPNLEVNASPRPQLSAPAADQLRLNVTAETMPYVRIAWTDVATAQWFKVFRDGQLLAETAVRMFPDIPLKPSAIYVVEAWRGTQMLARSEPLEYKVPNPAIDQRGQLQVTMKSGNLFIEFAELPSAAVAWYRLYRHRPDGGNEKTLLRTMRGNRQTMHALRDKPPATGLWVYTMSAVNPAGTETNVATSNPIDFTPPPLPQPAIELSMLDKPANAQVTGEVHFGDGGATFRNGHVALPDELVMDIGDGMTLSLEFKPEADCLGQMPLLLCHGAYMVDGWFLQILNGSLIFRTPAGDVQGPRIEPDRWYNVRVIFDGSALHMTVDGKPMPPRQVKGSLPPARRDMVIGQYDTQAPQFAFRGVIRHIRLYADAVFE